MKHDYDLSELQQISVRGLRFNIMPRYSYHYTDNDYEKFSLDFLDRLVEPGGTALDIGSHYGIYSLLAARKSDRVYAFEPVPENYDILKKNITDNKFGRKITAINKAISDEEGEVEFNIPWASDSAGFYQHPNAETVRTIQVKTNSIDNELKGIADVSFIKIDTEGHEIHVLDGLKNTLKKNKKAKMLIEFNPSCLINAGVTSRQLLEKITELNYDIFALHEEHRTMIRVTPEMSEQEILGDQSYLNLLCLPRNSWQTMLFLSHNSGVGGAELVLYETVQALVKRTDKFVIPYVIFPGEGALVDMFRILPLPIAVLPMRGWTVEKNPDSLREKRVTNAGAIAELAKVIDTFKPQITYTNTNTVPWLAMAAQNLGVPHVWGIHEFGNADHGIEYEYGYSESIKFIDSLSDKIIVNSKAVGAHIKPYVTASKVELQYYSFDIPQITNVKQSVFVSDTATKLIISGRIMPSKGQLDAVQAAKQLSNKGYNIELAIMGAIGSDEYVKEIKTFIKKHNLTNKVHFIDHTDRPHDYVARADIFLMCSRNEAFGRVTVEAMLLGKPVVGTDSGGTREIIENNSTGYTYKPGDSKDLASKVARIVDEQSAQKLGAAGKVRAEKLFVNNYHESVYKTLASCSNGNDAVTITPLGDILKGLYYERDDHRKQIRQYQHDLGVFEHEYNKVYKAYQELEVQHASLRNKKIIKAGRKIKSIMKKRDMS